MRLKFVGIVAALAFVLGLAHPALAQMGPGGGGMGMPGFGGGQGPGGGGGGAKKPKKKDPNEPETHAATGAGDEVVAPGGEPTLPEKPLEVSPRTQRHIGSDLDLESEEQGRDRVTTRRFYGPYYSETSGKYSFQLAFPVWANRTQPSRTNPAVTDSASLYAGLFYHRRSAEHADDILFPLVWNLNDRVAKSRTTIVGPFVNRAAPSEYDNWLAPLYFTGKRKNGGYAVIPPLLTYTNTDGRGGFNLVGPMFCAWQGGSNCDARTAQKLDFGVVPLYFYGQDPETKYEAIPPLLHYYHYNDRTLGWTNVWGPYYREHTQKRDMLHLLPLYFSIDGKNEHHTTFLPFFHYGYDRNAWLFVNPLFLMAEGHHSEKTFVTYLYARYRGRTSLDMVTPFYWRFRDPDIELDQHILFPFWFSRTSPRESTHLLFPFYGRSIRYGISDTTFVTPLFQHTHDVRGWSTNLYPLFYVGRDATTTHTIAAPFFWDFADPKSRTTVVAPVFWRFANDKDISQLVGNVYYHETRKASGNDWEVHIFPAFSYGKTTDGHWWNLLYGLAGYTHRGNTVKVRALWIPITLSGEE